MKKKYTRKQILESIKYWEKQLHAGNYRKLNESQLNEGKIADFFGKLFKTKKFLARQAELERAANAEFEKKHPLAAVAKKLNKLDDKFHFVFTNIDIEHTRHNADSKADCIVVRRKNIDADDRYDDMKGSRDYVLKLVKQCGFQKECRFYEINQHTAVIMQQPEVNWSPNLQSLEKEWSPNFQSSEKINESKISDFFGKLFQTRKFLAKQEELKKAADAEFEKQHPLAAVARKLSENENHLYLHFRFTNADVENNGYPWEMSGKADCIVVRYVDSETNKYDDIKDDEEKILKLIKEYGYQGECVFQPINSEMAVVMPKTARNWYITKINESKISESKIGDFFGLSNRKVNKTKGKTIKEKAYTRKQILEAISYWESQLRRVDEGKISDFFGKLFQTKKFLAKQAELERAAADAEFEKQHPLVTVTKKLNALDTEFSFRFTNVTVDHARYNNEYKADCIVVRRKNIDASDRYDDMKGSRDYVLKLVKQCGGPDNCRFYEVNQHMAVVMPEPDVNWGPDLEPFRKSE